MLWKTKIIHLLVFSLLLHKHFFFFFGDLIGLFELTWKSMQCVSASRWYILSLSFSSVGKDWLPQLSVLKPWFWTMYPLKCEPLFLMPQQIFKLYSAYDSGSKCIFLNNIFRAYSCWNFNKCDSAFSFYQSLMDLTFFWLTEVRILL